MRLTELNPVFLGNGGEGVTYVATGLPVPRREGVALSFDCPCGCGSHVCLYLKPPLDGGPPLQEHAWERTGDTFDTITLRPSILHHPCEWHGYITNGEVTNA